MAFIVNQRSRSPILPTPLPFENSKYDTTPQVYRYYYASPNYGAAAPPASALPLPKFLQSSLTSTLDTALGLSSRNNDRSHSSQAKVLNTDNYNSEASGGLSEFCHGAAKKTTSGKASMGNPKLSDRDPKSTEVETEEAKSLRELQDKTLQVINANLQGAEQQWNLRRNRDVGRQQVSIGGLWQAGQTRVQVHHHSLPNASLFEPQRNSQPILLSRQEGLSAGIVESPKAIVVQPIPRGSSDQWTQNQAQLQRLRFRLQTNVMRQQFDRLDQAQVLSPQTKSRIEEYLMMRRIQHDLVVRTV